MENKNQMFGLKILVVFILVFSALQFFGAIFQLPSELSEQPI